MACPIIWSWLLLANSPNKKAAKYYPTAFFLSVPKDLLKGSSQVFAETNSCQELRVSVDKVPSNLGLFDGYILISYAFR
jgi:hypothetical protein